MVASDAGKFVAQSSNSASVTVPNGVFTAGDMVTIVNLTATNINIVQGSGLDLNYTADGTTGTRTLAQKGVCTILFVGIGYTTSSGQGSFGQYMAKWNSSGTVQWQRTLSMSGQHTGRDVALDSSGNVYMCGESDLGTLNNTNLTLAKWASNGTHQWTRYLRGSSYGEVFLKLLRLIVLIIFTFAVVHLQ